MRALFAALALIALLAGCSSTSNTDTGQGGAAAPQATGSIAEQQQTNGAVIPGYTLTVPELGISNASMVALGLNADHTLQVPSLADPKQIGVYGKGPMPGANGPAIILSHINAHGVDGSFAHLADMKVGDQVTTTAPDGALTTFAVYKNETMPKSGYKTREVYSDTKGPELRLISCGGPLDATQHEYLDNIVVFLRKV